MRRESSDVNPGGIFDGTAHGSENSISIDNLVKKPGAPKDATGKEWYEPRSVSPENCAKMLRLEKSKYKEGQDIRLFACLTGKNPEGFAQKLADILGVNVWAPTDILWVGPDGKYVVSSGIEIVDPLTKKNSASSKTAARWRNEVLFAQERWGRQ
ncbi:MAG: hypothetical protein IPK50_01845 [Fibrobacterota bacterium]|nr:MAG: hypothetical protein IPK50_01845 [Fibrobacterota bacterium]